jgi:hypothetical protein
MTRRKVTSARRQPESLRSYLNVMPGLVPGIHVFVPS